MATPTNLYELFVAMGASPYVFHLTGSRFYGKERANSDWDFFVGHPALRTETGSHWLTDNGFDVLGPTPTAYTDDATAAVYRHPFGVDVQVLKPDRLQDKLWARETLRQLGIWSPCKSTMSALWDALLESDGTVFVTSHPGLMTLLLRANQPVFFKVPK